MQQMHIKNCFRYLGHPKGGKTPRIKHMKNLLYKAVSAGIR